MQSTRYRLIELLEANEGQYISGQFLSGKLNISRSAIWKHMRHLEQDGYVIEGVRRKGYRILRSPNKVSANTLHWGLQTNWLGKQIIHKTTTNSTQQDAHQAARQNAAHGTVIIADEQTNGKGRMDREWHSTKGKGIWMSMILRPSIPPAASPQLTLLTAAVLADVITAHTSAHPTIKWPNDLLINGKKAAGILTEMQAEDDQIQYVAAGIGINLNHADAEFPPELDDKATSLKLETNEEQHIVPIIQYILQHFEQCYDAFIRDGFANVKDKWESYGYKMGETIRIRTYNELLEAQFTGIAEDGALMVTRDGNHIQTIYSGEVEW